MSYTRVVKKALKNTIKFFCSIACLFLLAEVNITNLKASEIPEEQEVETEKIINNIIVGGNKLVTARAILAKIPYKKGQVLDLNKTGQLIRNIYSLGYFNNIEIKLQDLAGDLVNVYVIVHEKSKLEKFIFEGNNSLPRSEIDKKFKFNEILAVDEQELKLYVEKLKKLYTEKNYHNISVETELRSTERGNVEAVFKIKEGKKTTVKRVFFEGNISFPAKKLRSMIFTREDWLLGALDKSGTYQPDALEYDKHVIETFYQNHGYLAARVTDIKIETDESQCVTVTYVIEEGNCFTVSCVTATPNAIFTQEQMLGFIPVRPGQIYSRERLRAAREILVTALGQFGYIYADVSPEMIPNMEEKTVEINFNTDLGSQMFLNRIIISGNKKIRDNVIRRNLILDEGQLLTTQQMDLSKSRVESLGYFEPRDGVNWKTNRIDDHTVDLELILKEAKTGRISAQLGLGGADRDIKSPNRALSVALNLADRSAFGRGIMYNVNLSWSKDDRAAVLSLRQPWLFDRPISAGLDVFNRKSIYEDFKTNVKDVPVERVSGASGSLGFAMPKFYDINFVSSFGYEHIVYNKVVPIVDNPVLVVALNRKFQSGDLASYSGSLSQNLLNNPVLPSRGYNWSFATKVGLPAHQSCYSFAKMDFDIAWFSPLINEYDLIFYLHMHAGLLHPFGRGGIPYRELYNIGGPATVRGFEFGQIGPQLDCKSFGAQKAFWVNAELIFAITQDQSMRAVVFYDGGAGWDTPDYTSLTAQGLIITDNNFNYRHAIGFGIRLTSPVPLKMDWGFKLDRNKRKGEKAFELHFGMSQDF